MRPTRFVTLCFIYSGALLLATQVVLYSSELTVALIANGLASLCILFIGVYRLCSQEEEKGPDGYGPFAYGMALLSVLMTVVFLTGLTIF